MRVAFFVSGGGDNLRAALEHQPEGGYEIVLVVSDNPRFAGRAHAEAWGCPTLVEDFVEEVGSWRRAHGDLLAEEKYHQRARDFHDRISERIEEFERVRGPVDIVMLTYRRWIQGSLLARFRDRMINQHPGDLTDIAHGRRRFVGLEPVWDALRAGRRRTRTSNFLVDERCDAGPILAQGPWCLFAGESVDRAAASRHEHDQKRVSDWPLTRCVLTEIAQGNYAVGTGLHPTGERVILNRGVELPYGGMDLS